ncbi:hypothetical protein PHYSODRAFT_334769 [Phytophthora sojae]|uniref:Eukaryotic/viral aspartic protease n=1 Tax=Phytophthora sojae (strain P6497) TaxID=1094619 RepID=G4ZTL7_PHYSP|nr:hypothetical protein PHYSODRAFT_334769 [Phytophthora sojae]EGZ12928.1 hypothetical protein PHYSODRAFT_334769 [Phytophthora sojae]|eukprot:XP_009530357.1 hypothetical protein PHYSODRAFT_334769 [Phytophthora sojae]
MVPRPASTTSNDGLTIQEASEAGAQSAGRSPTAREHSERPVASWSSEGTFTTGHGASDDQEDYEEQFAVPDAAPDEGAAKGRDASRGPTGRKPAKADDQQQPTAKAATKRKPPKRKKKKLRAPKSAEGSLPKPQGHGTSLFRLLEQDPILVFLKPMLMSNFTGPFVAPDFDSLTSVAHAAPTLFQMVRDSGFVLGAFEMERLCDWDFKSWLRAIRVVQEPLTTLAGSIKQAAMSSATGQDAPSPSAGPAQTSTTTPSPPPRYQSSVDSDSSFESPKRMPMNRPPRVMQLSAAPTRTEVTKPAEEVLPKALRESIIKLMQMTVMNTPRANTAAIPTGPKAPANLTPTVARPQEAADVAMESVSSRSSTRSRTRRDADEDPDDLFDLDIGVPRTTAAVSTATAGGVVLARVRLSASSELKEFSGRDASEEKARLWLNRLKSAARRDGMTGEEVCRQFSDLMSGPARQWYLQLPRKVKQSWTELMEQFGVQYCGKGVSMASRYYHAAQRPDETPLDYLYRLNVAGLRANIPYAEGTTEEKREHVEHFIRTLNTQEAELTSPLTLVEVADSEALEKKLQNDSLGSNKFRQKALTPPIQPARAVHAIHVASDEYDSGRESRDSDDRQYDQDEADEERAKLFVAGWAPPGEPAQRAPRIAAVRRTTDDEFAREPPLDEIDLPPGERRGYWKHYAPHKWYKQAKIHGKQNNRRAVLLLDTGAEESILDTTFAREVGCLIDTEITQECVGIRDETYYTCASTVDSTACFPDEVHIQMIGRRPLYGARMHSVNVKTPVRLEPGDTHEVLLRPDRNAPFLWVTRAESWVTTFVKGRVGKKTYLRVMNIGDAAITLDAHETLGWWTPSGGQPRNRGFVRLGSTRYQQWQNLAYGATRDA